MTSDPDCWRCADRPRRDQQGRMTLEGMRLCEACLACAVKYEDSCLPGGEPAYLFFPSAEEAAALRQYAKLYLERARITPVDVVTALGIGYRIGRDRGPT